jgi:hypothetical protein
MARLERSVGTVQRRIIGLNCRIWLQCPNAAALRRIPDRRGDWSIVGVPPPFR